MLNACDALRRTEARQVAGRTARCQAGIEQRRDERQLDAGGKDGSPFPFSGVARLADAVARIGEERWT